MLSVQWETRCITSVEINENPALLRGMRVMVTCAHELIALSHDTPQQGELLQLAGCIKITLEPGWEVVIGQASLYQHLKIIYYC